MTSSVAFVRNAILDVVALNRLGGAFFAPLENSPGRPQNLARHCFLAPGAKEFYADWDVAADTTANILRTEAGRDPYNRALTDLVGELATRSEDFRTRWAAHNVRLHYTGVKHFHHPLVGDLTLAFNAMELPADPGLTLTVYTAEPGSPSAEKLAFLASWSGTPDKADPEAAEAEA